MVSTVCSPQYIRDQKGAGWQLNAIPVTNRLIGGDNFYELYFPRPWVIVGLVTLDNIPDQALLPQYGESYSNPLNPTQHNAYASMFQAIFLDLAFATTHEYDNSLLINYVEPGLQNIDYRGYFTKYLNAISLSTPGQWYNSLIQPESIVKKFCVDNAAAASAIWQDYFKKMIRFLEKTIDQRLMGAPGLYRINTSNGSASPEWDSQSDYEQFENA